MKRFRMFAAGALAFALAAGSLPAQAAASVNYTVVAQDEDPSFLLHGGSVWTLYQENGKSGLKTLDGTVVLPAAYDEITYPDSALSLLVVKQNGKYGAASLDGRILLEPVWKNLTVYDQAITLQTSEDQFGFADLQGNILIAPQYDSAAGFGADGYCMVGKNGKYSYIDLKNNLLLPWQNYALDTRDGYYFCAVDRKNDRVVDRSGNVIVQGQYDKSVCFYGRKLGIAVKNGKYGLINTENKAVVPFVYDAISASYCGDAPEDVYFELYQGDQAVYYDLNGKQIGSQTWEKNNTSSNAGRCIIIRRNGQYGLMRPTGEIVLEPQYDAILSGYTPNDPCFTQKNGLYGLVSADGAVLQEPVWHLGTSVIPKFMGSGYCLVADQNQDIAVISALGQVVLSPGDFDWVYLYANEKYFCGTRGETTYLCRWNEVLAPADDSSLKTSDGKTDPVVQYMTAHGILLGDENGNLNLGGDVTRAEFVALLSRVENWDLSGVKTGSFSDVPATYWAAKEIDKASSLGIISGIGNGKFDPNGKVTTDQALIILLRRCGPHYFELAKELNALTNSVNSGYSYVAQELGILDTIGYTYGTATRYTTCYYLYNYLQADKTKEVSLPDRYRGETLIPPVES